jgi:2-phospho-L-lactate/phosphoenolpyruvate guanylyltransferase
VSDSTSAQSERRIWAAVPFRGPVGSKRRLAGLLDASERERLSLAMLDVVLHELVDAEIVERVLLVTPAQSEPVRRDHERVTVVDETDTAVGRDTADGLNRALRQAQRLAAAGGADRLLMVPADLPLIGAADIGRLLVASRNAAVVIAPDRAETGTNALLVKPPLALEASFGDGSFDRHRRLAAQAGLTVTVVRRPGLALDLDTPADVAQLLASPRRSRLAGLLAELGVVDRLESLACGQARSTTI